MKEPLTIPAFISRSFIKAHKETHLFIYADDRNRNSYRGQAEQACGEENALAITTRFWNCYGRSTQSYFRDDLYDECRFLIDQDIDRIRQRIEGDKRILVLFPSIGCGEAELPTRAPKLLYYLQTQLTKLVDEHNKDLL